jgi:hypothetical protein
MRGRSLEHRPTVPSAVNSVGNYIRPSMA